MQASKTIRGMECVVTSASRSDTVIGGPLRATRPAISSIPKEI